MKYVVRFTLVVLFIGCGLPAGPAAAQEGWDNCPDRMWLGADYWANPMEDWRIVDGAAECQFGGGGRNIHLLTHQLTEPDKPFALSMQFQRVEAGPQGGGAGFRVGVRSDINEYRSNCFARSGIDAGVAVVS